MKRKMGERWFWQGAYIKWRLWRGKPVGRAELRRRQTEQEAMDTEFQRGMKQLRRMLLEAER